MKNWVGVGLLLVAAVWALLLWSPEASPSPGPDDQPEPPPSLPAATPVQPAVPVPPARAATPQAPDAPEPTEPAAPEPSTQGSGFKLPKLPPPEAKGPVTALKQRFGDESASPASKQHEQQLTDALQRTGPPLQSLEDVVCRRTVCRISWRWKAEHVIPFGQALGALRSFDKDPGIDSAGPVNADNSRSVAIYVDITAHKE